MKMEKEREKEKKQVRMRNEKKEIRKNERKENRQWGLWGSDGRFAWRTALSRLRFGASDGLEE